MPTICIASFVLALAYNTGLFAKQLCMPECKMKRRREVQEFLRLAPLVPYLADADQPWKGSYKLICCYALQASHPMQGVVATPVCTRNTNCMWSLTGRSATSLSGVRGTPGRGPGRAHQWRRPTQSVSCRQGCPPSSAARWCPPARARESQASCSLCPCGRTHVISEGDAHSHLSASCVFTGLWQPPTLTAARPTMTVSFCHQILGETVLH